MTSLDANCPACARPRDDYGNSTAAVRERDLYAGEADYGDSLADGPQEPDHALVAIARFKSAAEAGFFAHELYHAAQYRVALRVEEDFDAVGGHWSTRYVLSVPEAVAADAVAALQTLIADTDSDELNAVHSSPAGYRPLAGRPEPEFGDWNDGEPAALEHSGVNWIPIVLTLAAGSAALWGARKLQQIPQANNGAQIPVGGQRVDLWDHLADEQARPWIQQLENGRGRRELRIGPGDGPAVLREDADGDGAFETEWRFRRVVRNW